MLEDLKPVRAIRSCKVRTIREGLDSKDQLLLDGFLADLSWTPHILSKALGAKGLKVDHRQIQQHRDLTCTCRELLN